ncbi:twin-arginine translocase TatA/TatE family subunit [Vreelandella utahensis]|uniref:twin-arginine translocase TatA/TatE family subunit n=1 Tax=Vreelandella halophila TaxID=86177 RepID=UPI000987269A|nr:twin-arginine translocase TatA/TatE family subunit [Halomonas utahensis]
MSLGFWQIALIVLLFLLLFGRGRIPQLMGDLAEGIKSFRSGVGDGDTGGSGRGEGAASAALPDSTAAPEEEAGADAPGKEANASRRGAATEE